MRRTLQPLAAGWLGLGVLLWALSGCGTNRSELDILPDQDRARTALETALAAWKEGRPCGTLQGDSRGIEVVDRVWKAGGKLASYEIVGAEDKPGPRWFTVRLTLKNSRQPQQVSYAVLGLDPLWVYREEDYKQTCGMGNS